MPKIVTAGPNSKNPGRKFLQYDPSIAGELSKEQQALYDAQAKTLELHRKQVDAFVSKMKADAKAAGNTAEIAVMLNFGKVSIALDDGKGKRRGKGTTVPSEQVDWAKVGAALS